MSAARRWASTLLALWFAAFTAAPQLVHYCPEHSVQAAGDVAPATTPSHEGHADPAPAGHEHGTDQQCCCPGPACGAPALVPAPAASGIGEQPVLARATPPAAQGRAALGQFKHALPFATAPPQALTA